MEIITQDTQIPPEIGQLKRLKNLAVAGPNLLTLPESLLDIKTLKHVRFNSKQKREDWQLSEALKAGLEGRFSAQEQQYFY